MLIQHILTEKGVHLVEKMLDRGGLTPAVPFLRVNMVNVRNPVFLQRLDDAVGLIAWYNPIEFTLKDSQRSLNPVRPKHRSPRPVDGRRTG